MVALSPRSRAVGRKEDSAAELSGVEVDGDSVLVKSGEERSLFQGIAHLSPLRPKPLYGNDSVSEVPSGQPYNGRMLLYGDQFDGGVARPHVRRPPDTFRR